MALAVSADTGIVGGPITQGAGTRQLIPDSPRNTRVDSGYIDAVPKGASVRVSYSEPGFVVKDKLELEGVYRIFDVDEAASNTVAGLPGNRVYNLFIGAGNGANQPGRVCPLIELVNIEVAAGDI